MKITASHLGNLVLTILLFFCLIIFGRSAFAADTEEVILDGKVEVVYPVEATVPFKERKPNKSVIFGVTMDQVFFNQFRSKIDGYAYEDLFGKSTVNVIQAELGLKYNFPIGGIGASLIYGSGEVTDTKGVDYNRLSVRKKGLNLTFTMDSIFSEPYVAPYISGQVLNWDWDEKTTNVPTETSLTKSGSSAFTSGFQGGLLIQLNWLDPDSALTAQNASGMNNAFIDLFVSQYNSTTGAEDPNFQTDLNYGGGLKLEF